LKNCLGLPESFFNINVSEPGDDESKKY
jgi:hypothetical protein